jgi:hypothetical protein
MLPSAQAGTGHARDAPLNRGRSQSRLTRIGLLGTTEHRLDFAGESDRPTWNSRTGTSHLGDGSAVPTPVSSPGVVAGLLPFCASSPLTARGARAATRARWQAGDSTLSAANACDGSWENTSTMDGAFGALVPNAAGFRLNGIGVRWGTVSCRGETGEDTRRRVRREPHAGKRRPLWTASAPKTRPKWVWRGLIDLSTMSNGSTTRRKSRA